MLVVDLALEGVDDDGAVVGGDEVAVAHVLEGEDCALQLPRGGGTAGIPVLPGDVDFEEGLALRRQYLLRAGQAHGAVDVGEDGLGRGGDDGHHRRSGSATARRLRCRSQLFNGSHQKSPVYFYIDAQD